MPNDAMKVLIVDDSPMDAAVVKASLETTWHVLNYEHPVFEVAESKDAALRSIADAPPDLLVTDLFMPSRDIKKDLDARCDEMEWPHGLKLIQELNHNPRFPILVTTFFWNYPGFSRYLDAFGKELRIDGAIPKDIFYLVSLLSNEWTKLSEIEDFAPGRILAQVVYELTKTQHGQPNIVKDSLRRLHLRSLFEEGSAWLRTFPHHVADVRKGITLTTSPGRSIVKSDDVEEWDDFMVSARHMAACPWMPSFVFVSEATSHGVGAYQRLMELLGEDRWQVKMEMLAPMAVPDRQIERTTKLQFGGKVFTLSAGGRKPGSVGPKEPLLNPKSRRYAAADKEWKELLRQAGREGPFLDPKNRRHVDDHRAWAELLLTLGFFTYWCHLPKVRRVSVLSASEIAKIIRTRGGRAYRGVDDDKEAAEQIANDLEDLQRLILTSIKERKNDWGRFLDRLFGWDTPIGSKKNPHELIYWLNGSIRFLHPRRDG